MQDLLAPGALRGQDGPRRENLEPEEGRYCALQASHPQRGARGCSVTMEPMDCTVDGTGVAGRPGCVLLGAGLTVALAFDA